MYKAFLNLKQFLKLLQTGSIKGGKPQYNNNRIPWAKMLPKTLENFNQLSQSLNLKSGQGVYIQKALSYGGEGTKRVENQQELQTLLQKEDWQTELQAGTLKATAEIVGAYPSNGEACIIPDGKGGCTVVLGKPSLKPVNPDTNSGMGNDWGYQLSPSLQKQYTDIVTLIGKYLHKKYGYTGMFGPDCMVVTNPTTGEQTLYVNEVNARQQGTTDKQTENAVASNRIPIELLNHLVKLAGNNEQELKKVLDLVGNPNEYNRKVLDERGGFYIKIFGQKEPKKVTKDITGAWRVITDANGKMDLKKVPDSFYLSRQIVSPGFNIQTKNHATGDIQQNPVIWVTGPKVGEEVSKSGGSPCAYILGSEIQVFEQTGPKFTKEGKLFFDKISQEMFK